MRDISYYLGKIPPLHAGRPKFMATLAATLQPFVDAQSFANSLPAAFDLDSAIGAQLDVVGQWVNVSRIVPVPIEGIFFTLDDAARGFDFGLWKGPYDSFTGISSLDDDTYRILIRAEILSNNWDGSFAGAKAIVAEMFSDFPLAKVFVEDDGWSGYSSTYFTLDDPLRGFDQGTWRRPNDVLANIDEVDMAMSIGIAGKVPPLIILSLLNLGYLRVKPSTVSLRYQITSVNNTALFGFDVENDLISGFDIGACGISPLEAIEIGVDTGGFGSNFTADSTVTADSFATASG